MVEPPGERPRLRDGWHLFAGPGESWMLLSPEERFLRLKSEPALAARLARRLAGEEIEEDAGLRVLLDRFGEQGLLARPMPRQAPRRVAVRGGGPVADEVARLLGESAGLRVERIGTGELPAVADLADLVIACAGWLPDADWLRLDAWAAARGIAWHGCHAEGLRFYLGPLAIPGRTAGYADVRARRLAAARLPAELEAYWAYLDGGHGVPPVPWPGAGAVAAMAGALVEDALAWLAGRPAPSEGYQVAFDPARWHWHRHPVLPVPRDLLREGAA
jgi:hypothetical protein